MDIDRLTAILVEEEGWRSDIYDDATGRSLSKGSVVQGVPTVGAGLTGPFTRDELMPITRSRALAAWGTLQKAIPWASHLTDARQVAVTDLAYNLGVTKLLMFHTFLSMMQAGQYDLAAEDLEQTAWARQVGKNRVARICALIRGPEA